jgi:hypothetical protein
MHRFLINPLLRFPDDINCEAQGAGQQLRHSARRNFLPSVRRPFGHVFNDRSKPLNRMALLHEYRCFEVVAASVIVAMMWREPNRSTNSTQNKTAYYNKIFAVICRFLF